MTLRAPALLAILFSATLAWAQFPTRPVTIIVPIPPGGAPDIAARVLADKLGQTLGQPVVVENRVGANGNIANEMVAKAAPDGYTLGLLADSQITINPHLYKKMPIDTLKDLVPVTPVAVNQFVLTVNPSSPAHTLKEFGPLDAVRKAGDIAGAGDPRGAALATINYENSELEARDIDRCS